MTNPPPPADDLETLTRLAHDALEVYGPPTIVGAPVPGERRLALGFLALRQKLEEAEAQRAQAVKTGKQLIMDNTALRAQRDALVWASSTAFAALRHVEDWQWGKREADLREDELLSADTVRPMVANAIAELKRALAAARAQAGE